MTDEQKIEREIFGSLLDEFYYATAALASKHADVDRVKEARAAVIASHEQARGQPEDLLALRKEREALVELVALKDLKNDIARSMNEHTFREQRERLIEYERRTPIAWANARAALAGAGESK